MRAACPRGPPREACGLLLGEGGRIMQAVETRNVHPAPETRFEIDPQAIDRRASAPRENGAPQIIGYFHSHPVGEPVPSATDCAMAAGDGRVWAIIAGDEVRLWQDGGGDAQAGFTRTFLRRDGALEIRPCLRYFSPFFRVFCAACASSVLARRVFLSLDSVSCVSNNGRINHHP